MGRFLTCLLALIMAASGCAAKKEKRPDAAGDMVYLPGGTFLMGTDDGFPYEGPAHQVRVKGFWIDRYEVTNAKFSEFVKATGYVTEAEKYGWSGVFDHEKKSWVPVKGADWRHPEGPGSSIADRMNHPVVHVSWNDALAYARWAGKRLPTEAEFEYAARGGLEGARYSWGNQMKVNGRWMANIWQGLFPDHNRCEDGYMTTAPVGSFPPNGFGLYDMTGNVWEWCSDWFSEDYYRNSPRDNPQGPPTGKEKVIRGGSFLCSENYCVGYRVAARNKSEPDSGLNNTGFRCVRDP